MDSEEGFPGPVNLGTPREFTVRELAEMIINQIGSRSKLQFEPLPQDDPLQRKPDISLARNRLGWEPGVKLEDGLAKTIEHFRAGLLVSA